MGSLARAGPVDGFNTTSNTTTTTKTPTQSYGIDPGTVNTTAGAAGTSGLLIVIVDDD